MNAGTKKTEFPLNLLKKGQTAIILKVGGQGAIKRRMMDMGLVKGAEIKMVRVAPFGDPMEFNIKGYNLSLRKNEAAEILVKPVE